MKCKVIFAIVFSFFFIKSAHAQFNLLSHTIYYDGSRNYPGIVKFEVIQNNGPLTSTNGKTFSAPGSFSFFQGAGSASGTTIFIAIYKYNTSSPPFATMSWSYNDWLNNSLVINVPYKIYLDTHSGQNWYFYIEKVSTTDFHYWIDN